MGFNANYRYQIYQKKLSSKEVSCYHRQRADSAVTSQDYLLQLKHELEALQ